MSKTTATKERPILFSAPMVRAILDGTKTQTRRLMKPQPSMDVGGFVLCDDGRTWMDYPPYVINPSNLDLNDEWRCPFEVGMRLWVRESLTKKTSAYTPSGGIAYAADGLYVLGGPGSVDTGWMPDGSRHVRGGPWKWRRKSLPSIHMPRWASRLTLEVVDVRVERLNEITDEDIEAEGTATWVKAGGKVWRGTDPSPVKPSRLAFASMWNAINGRRYPWSSNPWVWIVGFRKLDIGGAS